MKYLKVYAAVLCLAASGCAQLACRDCGQGCHVTRSQQAPRPTIVRTLCKDTGAGLLGRKNGCDDCAGNCPGACDGGEGCYDNGIGTCGPNDSCDSQAGGGLCGRCGLGKCICPHSGGYPEPVMFNPGPPVGQVAYPYYTVRGPRDFLQNNPPSIGPY